MNTDNEFNVFRDIDVRFHGVLEDAHRLYEKLDLLLENAVEIGQIAALLSRDGKTEIHDGKEHTMFCVDLAKKIEKEIDLENGDYYGQIDAFARDALIEEFGKPAKPQPMKHIGHYIDSMHAICYVPEKVESDKDQYSHSRLLALVHGDEHLCKQLFDALEWQFPETLIDENVRDGLWGECEACGRYFDVDDEEMTECPHCRTKFPGDVHYDVAVDKELGYK